MTNLEKFVEELKKKGEEYKEVRMFVPELEKEIDFVLCLWDDPLVPGVKSINEYIYGLDETEEESEALEFWVQEDGGASLLAKSIGLVDTHYTDVSI